MADTDRELLELAAKAAGLPWDQWVIDGNDSWNPLTDDGDALRLAVKLGIYIQPWTKSERPATFARGLNQLDTEQVIEHGTNPCAATRLAIVRAAAEIGRKHHG